MYDFTHSLIAQTQDVATNTDINARFNQLLANMEKVGRERLLQEGLEERDISVVRWADMRYIFQTHEIKVDLPLGQIGPSDIEVIEESFHTNHERLYTFRTEKDPIEFVEVYVAVTGNIPKPSLPLWPKGSSTPPQQAKTGTREAFFESINAFTSAQIYDRPKLRVGNIIEGPAIIEEMDSTTVILPEQTAEVDTIGNIIISV
jgi:N-methylhydantoinase A